MTGKSLNLTFQRLAEGSLTEEELADWIRKRI